MGGPYAAINGAMTLASFTDRTVTVGQTYYYVLAAFDQVGNQSLNSNEAHTSPNADSTAPTIQSFSPAEGARFRNAIPLSAVATDNVAVTRLEFAWSTDGQAWQGIADGTATSVTWDTTAVATGQVRVRVRAFDAVGNSASLIRLCTVDHDAPATPTGLRVTVDQVLLVAAWDPVTAADFYRYALYRSVSGGAAALVLTTTSTVYMDHDVQAGATYTYYVIATDDLGNASAPTAEVSQTPLPDTAPPTVRSMSPSDGTRTKDTLTLGAVAFDNASLHSFVFEYQAVGEAGWTALATDLGPVAQGAGNWAGHVD